MGDGEAFDLKIAETKAGAGFEDLPAGLMLEAGLHCARRGSVGKDLDLGKFLQPFDAGSVIAVLVGEEDGVDLLERSAHGGEENSHPPRRKADVDEDARVF